MYRAKEQGGNNYQFFMPEMDMCIRGQVSMESALHVALQQNQFVLHYQPQIDLTTGRSVGVEALLRWNRPGHGLVPPLEFISLLEDTGLIIPVGEWVLRTALAQLQCWDKEQLSPLRMAVNLSARQLRQEHFVGTVRLALTDFQIDPNRLELEITESILIQHVNQAIKVLRELNALGVRLSIDDFGTGYCSLSYLKHFPIDVVKIDQSFVRDIPGSVRDRGIVRAVIALAGALEIGVIAEGVEREDQLAFLRVHGCKTAQGFLFSQPEPADQLIALLKTTMLL